jgi:sialic acid synthase SpsE
LNDHSDKKYRQFQKKTIVASQAISAGETLTREKVAFLRVEDQYPDLVPLDFETYEGTIVKDDIAPYQVIRRENLTQS